MSTRLIDLTGLTFGRLTVLKRADRRSNVGALWLCACACGETSIALTLKLRRGLTVSCGCYRKESAGARARTHGQSRSGGAYRTWKEMRNRCNNPKATQFKWYGGRGVKVCPRWSSFELFLEDMGERPRGLTLDRVDNDADYTPENCQWLSPLEQTRKQKKNKLQHVFAELRKDRAAGMTFAALGAKYGVSDTTAYRCATGATWN